MSCIIAVMDREQALEKMLPSWTKVEKIKDFVIVDWNSPKPIIENSTIQKQIKEYGNIKIIRVEDQKYFYRCLAWNLAFQNTNPENKILLKLDADYLNINHSWMDSLKLYKNEYLKNYFITGHWEFDPQLYGFLLVNKINFNNGYNENMEAVWGFEDDDLYARIKKENIHYNEIFKKYLGWDGLNHIIFFNTKDYILHIPHSNISRYENLKYKELIIKEGQEINSVSQKQAYRLGIKNKLTADTFKAWIPAKYETLEDSPTYKRVKLIKK
jgi:hypothetical protein